jgi:hypothetical protein
MTTLRMTSWAPRRLRFAGFAACRLLEPFYESSDLLGAWPHTTRPFGSASPGGRDDGGMDTEGVQLRAGNRLVSDITQVILQFCRDRGDGLRHIFVPHATARVALISGTKGAITKLKTGESLDGADLVNHGGEGA